MNWRLLVHQSLPGHTQMAIDEALYESVVESGTPTLRLYTWERPTLSLGYFQDYKRVVCEPYIVHNKIHVVRRLTGGRAVLHDLEMTYSVTAPLDRETFKDCSLQETYQLIAKALDLALQNLGVKRSAISMDSTGGRSQTKNAQCFVSLSQFEVGQNRRKIIGSAQKRSRDRFLQHGSILVDFNAELQKSAVNNPDPNIEEKIAPLKMLLGRTPSFDEIQDNVVAAFQNIFETKIILGQLEPNEQRLVKELETKYQSEDWTVRGCR
ncbi:MAG TPA: biotin/lipoate A/B protein ligase family protein [Acidobacteriota bacterium]|nr:biotin/lipoate A/B protein ligase family protein [Acidobacteriota bacterium]